MRGKMDARGMETSVMDACRQGTVPQMKRKLSETMRASLDGCQGMQGYKARGSGMRLRGVTDWDLMESTTYRPKRPMMNGSRIQQQTADDR